MTETQHLLLNACELLGQYQLEWIEADRLGQPTARITDKAKLAKEMIEELSIDYFQECNE